VSLSIAQYAVIFPQAGVVTFGFSFQPHPAPLWIFGPSGRAEAEPPGTGPAGLHECDGAAAAKWGPAFSPKPWPRQGPRPGRGGHGGRLLAGPRSAAQADRAALAAPLQTPAQETGGAQVTPESSETRGGVIPFAECGRLCFDRCVFICVLFA